MTHHTLVLRREGQKWYGRSDSFEQLGFLFRYHCLGVQRREKDMRVFSRSKVVVSCNNNLNDCGGDWMIFQIWGWQSLPAWPLELSFNLLLTAITIKTVRTGWTEPDLAHLHLTSFLPKVRGGWVSLLSTTDQGPDHWWRSWDVVVCGSPVLGQTWCGNETWLL